MEEVIEGKQARIGKRVRRSARIVWLVIGYFFEAVTSIFVNNWKIVRKEADLFVGVTLSLIGVLSFESGRYCDGNTADYLSCTRPATYYYFDTLDVFFVVFGVLLMLVWFFKNRGKN